jgi:1-acyl-sn-glycerol-3-phosphate acyltransferase
MLIFSLTVIQHTTFIMISKSKHFVLLLVFVLSIETHGQENVPIETQAAVLELMNAFSTAFNNGDVEYQKKPCTSHIID